MTSRRKGLRLVLETLEDRSLMSFTPAVTYAVGTSPQDLVTADFNGDNRADIAVVNASSNTVSVLLGNGDGTFQAARTSPTGSGPVSLAVGDFNGDHNLDLVTANAPGDDLSVLLGDGAGTFQAPVSLPIGFAPPSSVAVGDFNGDGKLDLGATSNYYTPPTWGWYAYYPGYYTGYANVLLGTGGGSFAPATSSYLSSGYQTGATVADFNADGKQDFVAVNRDYGQVDVLLGNSSGLGAAAIYGWGYYADDVAVGDFTGDGKLDIAAGGLLKGNGDGTFQSFSSATSVPTGLAQADFNGDGKLDLAVANWQDTVSVRLGTGDGLFKPDIAVATGGRSGAVAVGDFNGDGRPDMAAANASSNNIGVLLNDGAFPALDAPLISITDATVTEGNTGTVTAVFNVTLSAASTQTVTVDFATADRTAVAGSDYVATSGTVTFTPGQTSMPVQVQVIGDRIAENDEFFEVHLSNPTNAFVADLSGQGTITDDEPRVSIDYGPVNVIEGNSGTTTALFTVRLANTYDQPVSVNFSTAEGDTQAWQWGWYYYGTPATSGVDFQAQAAAVTFAPGDTVKTIPIVVYGDRIGESNENFSVDLTAAPNVIINSGHALGVIVDDEPRVSITSPAPVVEGNSGTTAMTFTVTLSAPSDAPITVNYTTGDSSATVAGGDYQANTGSVPFAAGQTSALITVLVNGDRIAESDESFSVQLTGATGAEILSGYAYGTIKDDEPRISITGGSVKEGNSGTTSITFTVTLSAAYDQTVTVNYQTQASTATAGEDYVSKSGTLTFLPGQTTKTFTVTINGDKKKEPNEYFFVNLSGASSNAMIASYSALGTILNDDGGPPGKHK